MQYTISLLLVITSLSSSSAFAVLETVSWDAGIGARFFHRNVDDTLNASNATTQRDTSNVSTKAIQFRASLGAQSQYQELEWRLGLRTKKSANDDYVLFQQNSDPALGIESSWLRYRSEFWGGDLALTFGRQKAAFYYDNQTKNLFADAVRFDGLNTHWVKGRFHLDLGQYSLGALDRGSVSGSQFSSTEHSNALGSQSSGLSYLLSIQPGVEFPVGKDVQAILGIGYFHWSRVRGFYTNTIHGSSSETSGASTGSLTLNDPRQVQVYNLWQLPFEVEVYGEWVKNLSSQKYTNSSREAKKEAWVVGLRYGNLKRLRGAVFGYSYTQKGLGAVASSLSNPLIAPDNRGHILELGFAPRESARIFARTFILQEMSRINSSGIDISSRQDHHTKIWEIAGQMDF